MSWIAFCAEYLTRLYSVKNKGTDFACVILQARCPMFYAGIDIAKYNHEAYVIGTDVKALFDSIFFSYTKDGCEKLLLLFEKLGIEKERVVIGMETTGHYWLSAYSFFSEFGYDVKVINPIQSEAFRKMYIRQTKNDSTDSFIIARIMRFGQFSATALSEENFMALRQLSRYRLAFVDECGDFKRRVIALLDQVFPEFAHSFQIHLVLPQRKSYSNIPRRRTCSPFRHVNLPPC